jgi:hypothetical protein
MKEIQEANKYLVSLGLTDSCRILAESLKGLDKEGTEKLGALFGDLLQSCSEPFEVRMAASVRPEPFPASVIEKLSKIASFLGEQSEKPSRLYVDVRAKYIILIVQPSLTAVSSEQPVYHRGTHPIIAAIKAIKDIIVPAERELQSKIFPGGSVDLVERVLKPVNTIISGHLTLVGKEALSVCDGQHHRFIEFIYLLDILEELHLMINNAGEKGDKSFAIFQNCFSTLLDFCKQWFDRLRTVVAQHSFGVPENAGIYEGTSLAMNCLTKMSDYEAISDAVLNTLDDTRSQATTTSSSASFMCSSDSVFALSFFVKQMLNGVEENFVRVSRLYSRPLKTNIFLLNNYNYLALLLKSHGKLAALVSAECEKNYDDKARLIVDSLEESWQRLASMLKDASSTSPKDAYKAFSNNLLEQINVATQTVIPDEEPRALVRGKMEQAILPVMRAFFHQHQAIFVSSTFSRTSRVDPDTIAEMMARLFEG